LKVTFNRYVPDTVHKAVSGAAVFTLTNTGAATFTGLVTVRVYSSTDAVFAPDDALVGSATLSVRNLRGGRAAQYSVDVAAFPAKYATRHPYLFVEVLPYGPTVPPTPQPFGNGDANVAVGSILVGAARARRAAVALVG
jgi:hypothetical protein